MLDVPSFFFPLSSFFRLPHLPLLPHTFPFSIPSLNTFFSRVHIGHIRAKVRSYIYRKERYTVAHPMEAEGLAMTLAAAVGFSSFAGTNIKYIPNGERKKEAPIVLLYSFDSRLLCHPLFCL